MKITAAIIFALALASPAFAQTKAVMPVAGETVEAFVLAPGMTVIFAPEGAKAKIVSVSDDPHAPVPRNAGQVAVAMTFNPELGTLLEFNSGLEASLLYRADPVKAVGDAVTAEATHLPTCPVMGTAVSSDQWPDSFPVLALSAFALTDRRAC